VRAELFARPRDPVLERAGYVIALKVRRHLRHDVLPKLLANALMDGIVAINGKAPRFWRNQKDHGVAMRVLMQLRLMQMLACGC
jgi:hypothetical protein